MSADTTPIPPARFAAALKALSPGTLHLKVLEIRNSIAHLQYSNDQLRPFAEAATPDPDCVDAIRENEAVIERMAERIALVRLEAEARGMSWREFRGADEEESGADEAHVAVADRQQQQQQQQQQQHAAWSDGTFQTGTIRNGQVRLDDDAAAQPAAGGSLSDEQLRRLLERRLRDAEHDDGGGGDGGDGSGGMHL